jgi:ATP-dependent RNA helicase UAP56/SUB2
MSEDELIEYEEQYVTDKKPKGRTLASHTACFKDFLLREELLKALGEVAFEHPSLVQQQCIPKAMFGADILCQAKSGTGKTAVFVLSTLHQIEPVPGVTSILVFVHTKELALQIKQEYSRFIKYLPGVSVREFYGGVSINEDIKALEGGQPTVFIGTPGRTWDLLVERKKISFKGVKSFVIDECDQCFRSDEMRYHIQAAFIDAPREKQVMMFSATLDDRMKNLCKSYMNNPLEVYVEEESKLTLHGLVQYYVEVSEGKKLDKVIDLLDNTEFNQAVIFVKDQARATWLSSRLKSGEFPSVDIHAGISTEDRMDRFKQFKEMGYRILVTTNLMARGIDVQEINLVINYDMPEDPETYLHRVGRAGRFETSGLAITFVESGSDSVILNEIQSRFEVSIKNMEKDAVVTSEKS